MGAGLAPPGGQPDSSPSPSVTRRGVHPVTLQGLPTMPFLGPAPTFSSSHTCTSLGGHGLLGQEPTFLGPRWGVAAPGCQHFTHSSPRSGAFSALVPQCHCQPQSTLSGRREGGGHSQQILRLQSKQPEERGMAPATEPSSAKKRNYQALCWPLCDKGLRAKPSLTRS